jgi:hypothetical protein
MPVRFERGKAAKLEGLKELQVAIQDIMNATVGQEVRVMIGKVVKDLEMDIAARIMAIPTPATITDRSGRKIRKADILASLFTYNREPAGGFGRLKHRSTALVGIRKRGHWEPYAKAYVEWFAGGETTSGRPKGTLIGESLATMIEIGTSKRSATPFFRPAITAARITMVPKIAAGYRAILQSHCQGAPGGGKAVIEWPSWFGKP